GTGTPGLLIANPDKANGFGLGMANTVFSYDGAKSGVVADIAFGPRADDANMAGAINQLYAYYNLTEKLTVTAGQFNTFLGYEVISPAANFNYSVSYLFNAGPFSHTGVKLDYAASEDLSFLLAVTNAHAITSDDASESGATQYGAQVGYKGQYLNFIYGAYSETSATDVLFLDYTGGFDLSESLYLGINAAYSYSDDEEAGYQGAALYIENTFSETFALGLRPEFFSYTSADDSEDVLALTLAASTQLDDNLKLITELRYDSSDDYIIEGIAAEKNATALTIAAVYSF
ncbi:porin, partial [Flavobacteriaceae bacterium]|nr:porin [Flavobacteriaceae bacterium]